jgi:hypothetical protein
LRLKEKAACGVREFSMEDVISRICASESPC